MLFLDYDITNDPDAAEEDPATSIASKVLEVPLPGTTAVRCEVPARPS